MVVVEFDDGCWRLKSDGWGVARGKRDERPTREKGFQADPAPRWLPSFVAPASPNRIHPSA